MSDNLFKIIVALIPVICAVITGILIPYVKSQINVAKQEKIREMFLQCEDWTKKAVWCAQQMYTPEQWEEKKLFVLKFLNSQFGNIFTEEQIKVLHEAAVKELKLAEKAVGEK